MARNRKTDRDIVTALDFRDLDCSDTRTDKVNIAGGSVGADGNVRRVIVDTFGDRLRRLRMAKGLGVETVADRVGVDKRFWRDVENGLSVTLSCDQFAALAALLEVRQESLEIHARSC